MAVEIDQVLEQIGSAKRAMLPGILRVRTSNDDHDFHYD